MHVETRVGRQDKAWSDVSVINVINSLINEDYSIQIHPHGATALSRPGSLHYRGFTITLRHTIFGRTLLDEWSARRRNLYLKIHNTHNRQTSMPPAGFEPAIPASERLQTHALDRAVTGIGKIYRYSTILFYKYFKFKFKFNYANLLYLPIINLGYDTGLIIWLQVT
jgi:hypothetical protein